MTFHPENSASPRAPRTRGPAKDPWKDLPPEWREKVEAAKDEDIRTEGGSVAFAEVANQMMKAGDEDLAMRQAEAKEAGQQYVDATKVNKGKLAYLRFILESRGVEPSAFNLGLQSQT